MQNPHQVLLVPRRLSCLGKSLTSAHLCLNPLQAHTHATRTPAWIISGRHGEPITRCLSLLHIFGGGTSYTCSAVQAWKEKSRKIICVVGGGHLAFYSVSRGPRPSQVCDRKWEPHCASLPVCCSGILNDMAAEHNPATSFGTSPQKQKSVPAQKALVVLDSMRAVSRFLLWRFPEWV